MKAEQAMGNSLARWATYREAVSQPAVWRSWSSDLARHAEAISAWVHSRDHHEIWFCGAGTSSFIGELLSTYMNSTTGAAKYRAVPTTDLVSCPRNFIRPGVRVLVVSFGRSGESPETLGTLDLLDAHLPDADRLNFTCNATGALATRKAPGLGEQRIVLLPPETNDTGFAMTSSYSTMLLSALACFDRRLSLPLEETIDRLAAAAEDVLERSLHWARSESSLPSRVVYLGSGVLSASARESALKVLELTAGHVPTSWDSTLGFRHGPKAVVDKNTRVHVLISNDPHTRRYDIDAANEIKEQFGPRSLVTFGSDKGCDRLVPMIGNDAWTSVLYVLAAQIQAMCWSDALRINVDNPFSIGSLTRVVKGVKLYPLEVVA
jgi:tagatose-6-phosphate ketose/aldose isomerase